MNMKYLWISIICVFLLGSSYSSGSKSSSSRSYSSGSSSSSFRSSGSSSKSYSSPSKSYSSSSKPSSVKSSYVPTKSFDSKASAAKEVSRSRSWFNFSKKEATPKPQAQREKQEIFYRQYHTNTTPRTVEIHHYQRDNYSPFFWLWLMERSTDERAAFAYNHRNDMDKERYADLLKKDAALEQKVKEIEAKNVKPDPNYKPEGIDNDLMFQPPEEKEGINPAWWLLILIPLAGGLFWVWKKY